VDRDFRRVDMETNISVLRDSIDDLEHTVRGIDEMIRGNGSPGIQTRLALQDQRISQLSSFMEEMHGLRRWMFFGVLSLLASIGWQVIRWYFQQPT